VHQALIDTVHQHPENVPFRYKDALYVRRFFATAAVPNMGIRKLMFESCRERIAEDVRNRIQLATDPHGRVVAYTDATGLTYYFEYDSQGRLSAVHGWDLPISYEYRFERGNIKFSYRATPNTGHHIKRFGYRGATDQIRQIDIFKNEQLEHSFDVKVEGDDVFVERKCS